MRSHSIPSPSLPTIAIAGVAIGMAIAGHTAAAEANAEVDFAREIKPILEAQCVQCHGPEKQKGKLRLDSREAWLKGGEDGPVFKAGHPEESDFFHRVTLGENEDDVMPPKGKADHLTPAQIEAVKRWINGGGEWPEGVVAVAAPNKKKSGAAEKQADSAGPTPSAEELKAIAALAKPGIKVRPIAAGTNWRRADLRSAADKVTPEDLALLGRISTLQELNLAGTPLRDSDLASFAALKNLTVLHVENTPITDAALAEMGKLQNLRYLNLFGTAVTDAGLKQIAGLKELRAIYVAGTKVTAAGLRELQRKLPQLQIEAGAEFADLGATKESGPTPAKKK
jgi:mono/diheme cytochrome c family protein